MEHPCQYSYGLVCPLLQPTKSEKIFIPYSNTKGEIIGPNISSSCTWNNENFYMASTKSTTTVFQFCFPPIAKDLHVHHLNLL